MRSLLTLGHGTASAAELAALLRAAGVGRVVDVRTAPGSRRNPEVGRDFLCEHLPACGIGYRWDKRLGGFRKLGPDSPDITLRNESFRAYAGHMRTGQFAEAIEDVLDEAPGLEDPDEAPAGEFLPEKHLPHEDPAKEAPSRADSPGEAPAEAAADDDRHVDNSQAARPTALMCSESLWWRCHRRLIADYLVAARGVPVAHLGHDGRLTEHSPTSGLRRRDDGLLVYDG